MSLEAPVAYDLRDVDVIRERMGVGYAEARDALEKSEGNIVNALAVVEEQQKAAERPMSLDELVAQIAEEVKSALAEEGGIARIDVKLGETKVKEVPVALAGVGAALMVILSALLAWLRLELVKRDRVVESETRTSTETGQA